jgi:hypothetical protein
MGSWHRMWLGTGTGAVITAIADHWSGASWLAFLIGGSALVLASLGHGWARPRWVQWRAQRREPGYVKVVGGFKSDTRTVIRYADGSSDVTVRPPSAGVIIGATTPSMVAHSTSRRPWWKPILRRGRQ